MKKLICALMMTSATAVAGGKVEPGIAQNPPRVADESDVYVELLHQGVKEGYGFKAKGNILNFMNGDRLRIDAMQGGKAVASAKCRVNANHYGTDEFSEFECQQTDKPIKLKGVVDFDLVYEDDKTDKEYLARRFSVNVQLWGGETWQVAPDDLLAVAYADMQLETDRWGHQLRFKLWMAATNVQASSATMRCTVDGKPLPDIETGMQTDHEITADMLGKGKRTTWHWQMYQINPRQVHTGPREGDFLKDTKKESKFLADNPGVWSCQVRTGGRAIRELTFTVDDKGFVKSNAMQSAKGAIPLRKSIALVDVKIPKDAMIDERIKPDQLKKSRGWGLAWPQDATVKTLHAALPPAFENQGPKYVKPKGKRVNGYEHNPPRFIDESSTELQVMRSPSDDGKGYQLAVFAVASGHTGSGDRFRLDWRQGKKVVAVAKCEWGDGVQTRVTCRSTAPLKTKGAHEADLIYEDDSDGNEYLLRTYKANVVNPKAFGDAVWLVPPDDALATAWMRPGPTEDEELQLFFWLATEKYGELKLRCLANGKQLPDITAGPSATPGGLVMEADVRPKQNAEVTEYYWTHFFIHTDILTGPKESNKTLMRKDMVPWLIDNPGTWDCMLRSDGKPIRQFLFTVNKEGYVEADPLQVDPTHPFLSKTVPVDLRFVKDSKLDNRIRGDAMKKSRGWGLPWPKPPTKAFPANSGLPDPK